MLLTQIKALCLKNYGVLLLSPKTLVFKLLLLVVALALLGTLAGGPDPPPSVCPQGWLNDSFPCDDAAIVEYTRTQPRTLAHRAQLSQQPGSPLPLCLALAL